MFGHPRSWLTSIAAYRPRVPVISRPVSLAIGASALVPAAFLAVRRIVTIQSQAVLIEEITTLKTQQAALIARIETIERALDALVK